MAGRRVGAAKRIGFMARRMLLFLGLVLLGLGLFALARPDLAREAGRVLDAQLMRLDKAERRLRYVYGWPQRGAPEAGPLQARLAARGLSLGAPVFIRIFKRSSELELWMKKGDRFTLFATYPICRWSGRLGPKLREGDRQSPEGFYTVSRAQLNPRSRWHRSFNLGFPNRFDRAHGRTGSFLMVHGGCSSIGCYAMTNPAVDEIWRLVTAALDGGQKRFAVHVFPFRPGLLRKALWADSPWAPFWRDLEPGYDLFEKTRVPPLVRVCNKRYVLSPARPGSDGSAPITSGCPPALAKS